MGKRKKLWKKRKKTKIIPVRETIKELPKIKKSDLEKTISSEYVSLTEGITYHGGPSVKKRNYFVYWTMDGNKTIFESGNVVLVDDEGSEEYFRQAFERKYKISIPKNKYYDDLIINQVQKYRDMFPK